MKRLFLTLSLFVLLVLLFSCADGVLTTVGSVSSAPPMTTSTPTATTSTSAVTIITTLTTSTAEETTQEITYAEIVYDTAPTTGENGTPYIANWNPYLLSPLVPKEYEAAFHQAIKAILNHRRTVVFDSLEELSAVAENLFYEFPPSALCTWQKNAETLTLTFTYTDSREAHLEKLAAFRTALEAILEETLFFGDSEAEKAILLYHAISYTVDYFQVDYTHAQTNAFYALTEKKAICYSFADAYNYLLRQVGMTAYLIKGCRSSDLAPHGWSLVEIDGAYYHCDPTWESSMCDGAGLYYFGLSDTKRGKTMMLSSAEMGVGILGTHELPKAESDRFLAINGDKFRFPDWTLERGKDLILYRGKKYDFSSQ